MGLDMYLSARKYVNKIDWAKLDRAGEVDYDSATFPQYNEIVQAAGLQDVQQNNEIYGANVSVNCAYWRKVNAVHNWFVNNVQKGEDDCGEYYVSQDKLLELLQTCKNALAKRDPQELMPQAGFFFGSYDIDEYYWSGIKHTVKQIERLTNLEDFDNLSFYYQSSW